MTIHQRFSQVIPIILGGLILTLAGLAPAHAALELYFAYDVDGSNNSLLVKGGNATPVDINNSSGPAPTGITATDQHPGTSSVAGFGYSGWSATQDNGKYVQFTLKANIGQYRPI
jgi:hypothetical protein